MRKIMFAVIVFSFILPTVAFAQDVKCPRGYQPYAGRCITQRMADYISCVEASGGNRQEISDAVSELGGQKASTGVRASGSGAIIKGSGGLVLDRASEKALVKKLETKWFPEGMDKCAKVLGKTTVDKNKKITTFSPEIKCQLKYPFKREKDVVLKRTDNPEIIITNIGAVKAVAFSVDFKTYIYDISSAAIEGEADLRRETHGHLIFVKELQPSDEIKQELNGFHGKGKVGIYAFTLKYYRESDMRMFTRHEMFFIEDYEIFQENDYKKNNNYRRIIQAIKSSKLASNVEPLCLLGIDNNTWLIQETPKTGIQLLQSDGKGLTFGGIPEDPRAFIKQAYLNDNRPLLYVRPSKLVKTGTYVDPEIIDEKTVEIRFRYEVENIGNAEAINVSEIGGVPYNEPLKPGGKFYLNSAVRLIQRSGVKQSPQDLIRDMDKQEYIFEHRDTIVYLQKTADKEYIAKFIYRIGKEGVKLVKYEIN